MKTDSRRRTLLLIEDDRLVRSLARRSLERAGYEVQEASDGETGLAMFAARAPDMILLDVVMPGMNGFDVCRSIRRSPSGDAVPVLMMTGLDDVESIHEAFAAGATDFIGKPLPWSLLPYRVQYLLRSSDAMLDLRRSERRLDDAQRAARLGYWDWSAAGDNLALSTMSATLFGEGGESIDSIAEVLERVHPGDRERLARALQRTVLGGAPLSIEFRLTDDRADPLWLHARGHANVEVTSIDATVNRIVTGTFQDISDIKKREAQTRYLAYFDRLTGLPNRANLTEQLDQKLASARRQRKSVAVMILDVDNFKQVNETMGRAAGDELLARLALRLRQSVRSADALATLGTNTDIGRDADLTGVACMGGDEFAVIIDDITGVNDVDEVARRLLDVVRQPVLLEGRDIVVSSSIGVAVYPVDGEHSMDLLAHADSAMHGAKSAGGDRVASFSEPLRSAAASRFSQEMGLRRAVERNQLTLQYQPKMRLSDGRIVGVEALLRWNHPDLGPVSPAHFIPIAEQTGIILEISDWVLRTAFAQVAAWNAGGIPDLCVAINLSAKHFASADLVARISSLLSQFAIKPASIELEITEGAIMHDVQQALRTTRELRQLGCSVAIDDFGTGYSSLAYLRQLSADHLKIDRAFITNLKPHSEDGAIVKSIVEMANVLGMRVIAEGVETTEQLQQLALRGCHEVQGFLISRPVPPDVIPLLMSEHAQCDRAHLLALPIATAADHSSPTLLSGATA